MINSSVNERKELLYHIIGVATLLSLPIIFSPDIFENVNLFHIQGFRYDFYFTVFLVIYFYICHYWLVEKMYLEKKYLLFIFLSIGVFLLINLLADKISQIGFENSREPFQHRQFGMPLKEGRPHHPKMHIFEFGKHLVQFFMMAVLSILIKVNKRRRLLEKEKKELELSYLKSKLNPHFLFNTLNGIYALSLEQSDRTAPAVVKLSGMMRYLLTEAEKETVALNNEIDYIRNYIDLQKLRLTENNQLKFNIEGDANGKYITPMILMTFIENAFKYGVNPDFDSEIDIGILIKEKTISLNVYNTKSAFILDSETERGRGLNHTIKILENKYGSNYLLEVKDEPKSYRIKLDIQFED